ncbi:MULTISPECIES: hypothetical protein [Halomonas]|uniref:hypothetical protein n=1 Tax=Halomonas TaxID=2745 RepID=UPI001C966301|nr:MULTISPECIES: hypothetical protein [Halomonas]MBY6208759.1 hypothetical protein [Halomonas sp. DP3Y7-2]MBY6227229.1 hypothetical protein [Halomonas sp. DP3Y7-1]MCA0915021.1 hypothetical protein [Halomonas denitrificans]
MTQPILTASDIANLDMPPASARYQGRTNSMTKRLGDMVRERGIERGTLSMRVARLVDPRAQLGQSQGIAGANFTVVP